MKNTTALHFVVALAALSFAGQAFAKGGSMGGGQGNGTTGGTHQMPSTMLPVSGKSMQPAVGSGKQNMKQGRFGNGVGHQNGQMNGNLPVTTASN